MVRFDLLIERSITGEYPFVDEKHPALLYDGIRTVSLHLKQEEFDRKLKFCSLYIVSHF